MARIATAVAAAALILAAAGCGAQPESADEPPDTRPSGEPIAAKVGTEFVTVRQVEALLDDARRSFHARARKLPPESDPYYADLRDEAVRHLVERRLREQIAEQLGVDVSEANRNDLLDFETYRAISQSTQPDETMREALARWRVELEEQFARVTYVSRYRPAEHRRAIPLELRRLPRPKGRCDLKDGMYWYFVARAHGCLGPEENDVSYTVPPCPEIPASGTDAGFTAAEADSGYADYVESGTSGHDFFEPLTTNREDLASESDPEGPECQDFQGDFKVSVGDVGFRSIPAP